MALIPVHDERILLQQVAEGNETAFRQLYAQWHPQLASFILQVTKSKELTAEIVQDVFLKIWISRETLAAIENFKAYLFVVSRNQALNALRKQMRELKRLQELEKNTAGDIEPAEDPQLIQLSLIDEAIDQLSPRQKEIYLLHRHQRLTYVEIAQQLGIGRESVKTHLQLAVKSITNYLKDRMALTVLLIELISKKF